MDHRVPRVGAAISVLLAIGAAITFVFLNQKFEGPDPTAALRSPYELSARFENVKTLPTKQPVLYKGVSVGRVSSVEWDERAQETVVTFTLTDEIRPVHADAKLQIGERSLLGDASLNLLDPGTEAAGELESGAELGAASVVPHVNFDEALDFLDAEGRDRVRSLIGIVARGTSRRGNGARLNGTVGGAARTLTELRRLTDALRGQEQDIAGLVADTSTVVGELGERERAIRTIVGSGRATLDALATSTGSLDRALVELPPLVESGRRTLAQARPLLDEARPLLSELRALAPDLVPAFEEGAPFSIGPISADLIAIIEGLEPQRRISERLLPRVTELNRGLLPLTIGAGPAALNTVPIADYLAPRSNSIGAFYGLGASVIANSDSVGRYARFAINGDPALGADAPSGAYNPTGTCPPGPDRFCWNAFPEPNDALDNQPFQPGTYPRLLPFEPPPRRP